MTFGHRLFRTWLQAATGSGRELRKFRGVSCELGFLNMAAPLSVEVEFGGHPEPPHLDQEEFAKRAARAVPPGRQCATRNSGAD
ncbi:ubiquitin-related modifier 1 isoform X3 [Marmota marmota marmota]|uniref:ubiquitin-related modifier 1 isoform X3 n=1 Tax=Marmota marmota marmota TaxID=9994 RepID=UPI00209339C2|nr:ubiquitin-related modifier 1 isoform X3 [Marmota marmota marmota]